MTLGKRPIDEHLVGLELAPLRWSWDERTAILYALGVGATVERDLPFPYEAQGPRVLPTFGVILATTALFPAMIDAVDVDLHHTLHGAESLEVLRPIPPAGEVETTRRVTAVWDKGHAAVTEWESVARDADGDLVRSRSSFYHPGIGGFGGDRGPRAPGATGVDHDPDVILKETTTPDQGAVYRLSGDRNPIHIDPGFAQVAGFPRPFLHGLCTFGVVGRALLDALCAGDPARFLGLSVRFSGIVEPGDDLRVDVWRDGDGDASFEATTPRGPALSHGRFTFQASIDDQEAKVPTTREDAKTGGSAT